VGPSRRAERKEADPTWLIREAELRGLIQGVPGERGPIQVGREEGP